MMHRSINRKNRYLFYLLILLLLSNINNLNLKFFTSTFFQIKYINIEGLNNNYEKILKNQFKNILNQNIFFLNKRNVENILLSKNYIHKFSVTKKYPSEIYIFAEHTKLVGKTILNGQKYYLGLNGKFVNDEIIYNLNLPNIFGTFKPDRFIVLYKSLEENGFGNDQITDFYYFENNRWDIKTQKGIIIKLPNKNFHEAIKVVKKMMENNNFEKKIIDLRVANQVIIGNAT